MSTSGLNRLESISVVNAPSLIDVQLGIILRYVDFKVCTTYFLPVLLPPEHKSPVDDAFDLRVLLHLLLLEAPLTVVQPALILHQDLTGRLLLGREPLLVLLQLAMGHLQPLLQGVDLLFVLSDLKQEGNIEIHFFFGNIPE